MLHSVGIDRGSIDDRKVSVNLFTGKPVLGSATPVTRKYVSLPSSGLTFRRLFLPRASKSVRQQVIGEELSYSLPFPLYEAHYGIVETAEDAWVAVAANSVVQPIQELYPKAHLEAEPLCYVRAARAAGIRQALVIDLGARKTVFCGVENGQVGTVRVLLRGGDAISSMLASELNVDAAEAEQIKIEEGTEQPTVRAFYQELVEEALLPTPLPYRRVLLCGGGSATPGLLRLLTKIWGNDVDVEPFPLPGELSPAEHVVAYGAALAGRPRALRLEMEQGTGPSGSSRAPLSLAPIVFSFLLMMLMVVTVETRLGSARGEAENLRTTLNEALEPVLDKPSELDESDIVKRLRERLTEQRNSSRSSPSRLMSTLGKSASAVTANEDSMLFSIIYEDDTLKLEGRASSLQDSESIKRALEQVMLNVEMVRTRPTTGDAFIFQIEGQLPEP